MSDNGPKPKGSGWEGDDDSDPERYGRKFKAWEERMRKQKEKKEQEAAEEAAEEAALAAQSEEQQPSDIGQQGQEQVDSGEEEDDLSDTSSSGSAPCFMLPDDMDLDKGLEQLDRARAEARSRAALLPELVWTEPRNDDDDDLKFQADLLKIFDMSASEQGVATTADGTDDETWLKGNTWADATTQETAADANNTTSATEPPTASLDANDVETDDPSIASIPTGTTKPNDDVPISQEPLKWLNLKEGDKLFAVACKVCENLLVVLTKKITPARGAEGHIQDRGFALTLCHSCKKVQLKAQMVFPFDKIEEWHFGASIRKLLGLNLFRQDPFIVLAWQTVRNSINLPKIHRIDTDLDAAGGHQAVNDTSSESQRIIVGLSIRDRQETLHDNDDNPSGSQRIDDERSMTDTQKTLDNTDDENPEWQRIEVNLPIRGRQESLDNADSDSSGSQSGGVKLTMTDRQEALNNTDDSLCGWQQIEVNSTTSDEVKSTDGIDDIESHETEDTEHHNIDSVYTGTKIMPGSIYGELYLVEGFPPGFFPY